MAWIAVAVAALAFPLPPRAIARPAYGAAAILRGVPPARDGDRGEDVLAREGWFYSQRAFPRASIPIGAYLRARRQAAKLPRFPLRRAAKRPKPARASQAGSKSFAWTSIGPRPIYQPSTLHTAGRVTALAVQDAKTVYAGAAAGGVWKTTDGGNTWTPVFDDLPTGGSIRSLAIGSITIDPNNSNTVLVGTGEGNFSQDSYYGTGLWRSPNAGASWSKVGGDRFDSCSVSDIVVKPGDSQTIAVAVVRAGVPSPTPSGLTEPCAPSRQGVHVSTDGGSTWSLKAPPPGGLFSATGALDLAISPANPAVWFAGMGNGAVWRSTDSGQHWGPAMIAPFGKRTQLAISPSNPNFIVAAVETPPTVDLFLSSDGGATWNNTDLPVPRSRRLCGSNRQCWYDLAVTFDPSTPRVFSLGAVPLYRYTRPIGSGWSFTRVASAMHLDVHALAHDPAADLWIGNDGGVDTLRWTPQGQTVLAKSADLPITEFEPGISGDLSQLIGGTQDNGTLRYTGALTWRRILGGDGGFSASHPVYPQTIWASQNNFAFKQTNNGGVTWFTITPTLATGDSGLFYSPFANEQGRPDTLYAGSRRLWRSTNRGASWTAISPLFTLTPGNAISAIGTGTTTATVPNATAYVGFSSGGVLNSSNITATTPTWTGGTFPAPPSGSPRWVTDFWVNPSSPTEAYAAVSGFGTDHLFHTTNGVTWVSADGTLPNTPVNAVTVDTSGAFPIVYVGTDVGVFASGDGGENWANASTNLPPTVVIDLLIDASQRKLIAATHGRGAYTARLSQAPPFADITAPTTITDPVVARFNVPVSGVTPSNFVLRVAGTPPPPYLPASIRCKDSSGLDRNCVTGPVSVAELQPMDPLIPGQRYVAIVDPNLPVPKIHDSVGTDVPLTFRAFRASLKEQETSPAAVYTWQTVSPGTTPGPLGGDYTRHHLRRASASYKFAGPQITWITVEGPDQGFANVFIDNSLFAGVDNFAPVPMYNVRRSFVALGPGEHVIRIEPTGQSKPGATDTFVSIDGFQVGDTTPDPTPVVTYTWQPDSAFESTIGYVRSDLGPTALARATTATFTFRGTGVSWQAFTGPSEGQARVLIDGVDRGVVDNYSPAPSVVARTYAGLADGVHTMTITVLGTKQPASNGTFVSVESWEVQ